MIYTVLGDNMYNLSSMKDSFLAFLNQNNDTNFIEIKQKIKKLRKIENSEICHV